MTYHVFMQSAGTAGRLRSRRALGCRGAFVWAVLCLVGAGAWAATPAVPPLGSFEDTGAFGLWLLNDEAQTLQILAHDRAVLDAMQAPLPVFPDLPRGARVRPELLLIDRHQRIMRFFGELVDLSRQHQALKGSNRGLEPINAGLQAARERLTLPLFRLFMQYLDDFAALYPSEKQARALLQVLPSGAFSPDSPGLAPAGRSLVAAARPGATASGTASRPATPAAPQGNDVFALFGDTGGGGSGSAGTPAEAGSGDPALTTVASGADADNSGSGSGTADPAANASGTADASGSAADPGSGADDPFNVFGK